MNRFTLIAMAIFLTGLLGSRGLFSQPAVDGFNVYYGDLHNHCNVSDGTGTPAQAYAYARDVAHYDYFGLSDHANLISSSEWTLEKNTANAYNDDSVFTAFCGFEWTTYLSYGHVTIVNTEDYCSNSSSTSNFTGLLNWVNARNCIAFFNHPGWEFFTFNEFDHFSDPPSSKFVGIELFNTLDGFSKYYYNDGYYSNDGNKGYYDEALVRHWKVGAAGGDDNHTSTWGTDTPFRTGVLAKANTRTEIFAALQARRFFSTLDKNLVVSMKINGYDMGSTIQGGTWNVIVKTFDQDNEVISNVSLIKNGVTAYAWAPNVPGPVLVKSLSFADGDYIYVKVKEADGDEAISSPIYFSGVAQQPPQVTVTSPGNGSVYTAGDIIQVAATAVDPDGTISGVKFFANDVMIGQDNTAPFSMNWICQQAGEVMLYARATDNSGLSTDSQGIHFTVNPQVHYYSGHFQIRTGSDDAEETGNGLVILDDPELFMVYDESVPCNQTIGLLFRDMAIPKDAQVFKASLHFTSAAESGSLSHLVIEGEASSCPEPFTGVINSISSRSRTSHSVDWQPVDWKESWLSGSGQETPDLSPLIMEILKRSDSAVVRRLVFIITGDGLRRAVSFENNPEFAAKLLIDFSTGTAISTQPITRSASIDKVPGTAEYLKSTFMLVPNPAGDESRLICANERAVKEISVYSVDGIRVQQILPPWNEGGIPIDCRMMPPGLYLVKVSFSNHTQVLKLIRK